MDKRPMKTVGESRTEQVQIVTTDASIKTVADLAGKRVSIGSAGSGVYFNAIDILGAYGLTEDDIIPTYQSFGDSADSLKNGQIDAAFIVAGAPTTAVTDLATTKDVYLVSLDDEHVDKLLASSPYYTKVTISKDVYGLDTDDHRRRQRGRPRPRRRFRGRHLQAGRRYLRQRRQSHRHPRQVRGGQHRVRRFRYLRPLSSGRGQVFRGKGL